MSLKKYSLLNKKFWNREYYAPNVEGFIFRLKPKLLDLYINKKKLRVLDYGCGEGSNIKYLIDNYQYDGYGVDISEKSIEVCKKKINSQKFKLIDFKVNKKDKFFNKKFDLILSIQVLYYLSKEDLNKRLISFKNMLNPNGYVFFTMKSIKSDYWKYHSNKKSNKEDLTLVDLTKDKEYKRRQKQETYKHYINFTKSEEDLKKKFKLFKPIKIGFYDGSLDSTSLSGYHYTFFGKLK
jgi:cyclopropane fatty-acyl-phospholipid synthase-like methyltransferase